MRAGARNGALKACLAGCTFVFVVAVPGVALAQLPPITPNTSVTPTSQTAAWIIQMTLAAVGLGILVVLGIVLAYVRFSPKFFGRQEAPPSAPPGARPPLLTGRPSLRQAATAGIGSATTPSPAVTTSGPRTATAVAERPLPAAEGAPAEVPTVATASAPAPPVAPAAEAATQAPAPIAEAATQAPAPAAEAATQAPAPTPAPPTTAGASASRGEMDQDTFDRVLKEQLDKGVDRRVAEGRARAAAVVAARKKRQA